MYTNKAHFFSHNPFLTTLLESVSAMELRVLF